MLVADGRQFWYDFYPIEELIALYIQGTASPVMLFHISVFKRIIEHLPFFTNTSNSYTLTGNTVWISSQVLTKGAPANCYTGLKIKGGEIKFSEAPQHVNNNLSVQAGVTVTVNLQLDQPAITNADDSSDYGKDARAASLTLPQQFNFNFSGISPIAIDSVSNASWNLYDEQDSFKFNPQNQISYDNIIKEILIPFTCSADEFSINNNLSSFNVLSGNAPIQWSAWALPVAQIDINNPTAAEGIGSLTIRCDKGLFTEWKGHAKRRCCILSNPYITIKRGKDWRY